jgi:hypothetical protein
MLRALASAAAAALFITASASGEAPAIARGNFSDRTTDSSLCVFPIVLSFEGNFTVTRFFDQDRNLVRATLHAIDVGTATNPVNGNTLTGHEVIYITSDLVAGIQAQVGVPFHFNVTGGSAIVDAGRLVLDRQGETLFESGNHELLEGDLSDFCGALA